MTNTDTLKELVEKARTLPEQVAELVAQQAAKRQALHDLLAGQKEIEAQVAGEVAGENGTDGRKKYPNEEARKGEVARRLKADTRYQAIEKELARVRGELVELETRLEQARYEHRSAVCLLNLLASAIQANRPDIEQAVLGQAANANGHKANGKKANGLVEMAVEVLGAMPGKNQGTIKAMCRTAEGEEITVFAKDDTGRKLAKAIGEVVTVKARKMEDSGNWFAVMVK